MTSVHRALALSVAERYLLIALSLASSILLARLLTPEEIGIYSVSLAVIGIAQVLRDFGVGNFLIQVKDLTEEHIRTAFGISLVIGGTLFMAIYFVAPFAATFYSEPRILETLRISALNFLTLPFCTISMALLRREMAFNRLVTVTLIATTFGFVVTLGLAYAGFGPNSMAIGTVFSNIATGIGALVARTDRKLLLPSFSEWRVLVNFGKRTIAANIVTTVAMDINDLALGKILGFGPVAMISRAQGLMNLFNRDLMNAVRNVAYPAFAATHRQGNSLESTYVFSVASVTAFAWPFYAFLSLFPLELLRLMFGSQWDAALPLIPVFCLAGGVAATFNLVIPLLMAQGHITEATRIDLILQPIKVITIVASVLIFKTEESFAISFLAVTALALPYHYYVKSKAQTNNYKSLVSAGKKSAILTLISCTPATFFFFFAPRTDSILPVPYLILCAFLCAIFWIYGAVLIKHPLANDAVFRRQLERMPFIKQG